MLDLEPQSLRQRLWRACCGQRTNCGVTWTNQGGRGLSTCYLSCSKQDVATRLVPQAPWILQVEAPVGVYSTRDPAFDAGLEWGAPMGRFFLNSFWPLCSSLRDTTPYPPFCDGSIRREPDFQNPHPSISSLCRPGFAERKKPEDVVVYMTCKGRYNGDRERGWRIVAALRVREKVANHEAAGAWYDERHISIPGNCMVERNKKTPVEFTHLVRRGCARVARDDAQYWRRAKDHPSFLICDSVVVELHRPPQITEPEMLQIFGGKFPGTESGKEITKKQYEQLIAPLQAAIHQGETIRVDS